MSDRHNLTHKVVLSNVPAYEAGAVDDLTEVTTRHASIERADATAQAMIVLYEGVGWTVASRPDWHESSPIEGEAWELIDPHGNLWDLWIDVA